MVPSVTKIVMNELVDGEVWGTRRAEVHVYLNPHFRDAIKAEAEIRGMSISSFMRAMIRGYFAAALHCR